MPCLCDCSQCPGTRQEYPYSSPDWCKEYGCYTNMARPLCERDRSRFLAEVI